MALTFILLTPEAPFAGVSKPSSFPFPESFCKKQASISTHMINLVIHSILDTLADLTQAEIQTMFKGDWLMAVNRMSPKLLITSKAGWEILHINHEY